MTARPPDSPGLRSPAPIYTHGCLTDQRFGSGTCDEQLDAAPWMCERDGRVTVGTLVVLADSAIGWALTTRMPESVIVATARLRVELFRQARDGERSFRARGSAMHVGPDVGFGRAELLTATGEPLAMATMRSAQMPLPEGVYHRIPVDGVVGDGVALPDPDVDTVFRTELVERLGSRATVALLARPELTNASAGVHGGVMAMMSERAIVACLDEIGDPRSMRPLDFDIDFLRPLPGDGAQVRAHASVVETTRRFVQVEGMLVRADGRAAARVRATYARAA